MLKKVLISSSICIVLIVSSCSLLKMKALSTCEFKLNQINSVTIAGVKINPGGETVLGLAEGLKILESLSRKQLPLSLDLGLNGNNPNAREAQMMKFDWKIHIKDEEVLSGTANDPIKIPAQSNTNFNFAVSSDVYSTLSKYKLDELKNLAKNALDQNGNPKDLKIFIKPYLSVASVNIPYPGFIEIMKFYKSF